MYRHVSERIENAALELTGAPLHRSARTRPCVMLATLRPKVAQNLGRASGRENPSGEGSSARLHTRPGEATLDRDTWHMSGASVLDELLLSSEAST